VDESDEGGNAMDPRNRIKKNERARKRAFLIELIRIASNFDKGFRPKLASD
jgi:hypothetical protein